MKNIHILGNTHPCARYIINQLSSKNFLYIYSSRQNNDYKVYDYESFTKYCKNNDIVISISPIKYILPLIKSLIDKHIHPSKLIVISSSSIYSKIQKKTLDSILFNHFIKAEEEIKSLRKKGFNKTNILILRTTMLWGNKYDKNINFIYNFFNKYKFFPISSNSKGLRAPIHYKDLSILIIKLLDYKFSGLQEFDVYGSTQIPFKEIVRLVKLNGFNNKVKILMIPYKLLVLFEIILRYLPKNKLIAKFSYPIAAMIRQSDDLIYKYNDVRKIIPKFEDKSFEEHLIKTYKKFR